MRPTATCLYKGFWARSLDEFKRLSNIVFKSEGVKGPSGPMPLHSFHTPDSISECKTMSDADIGGFSKAALDFVPASGADPPHARFHGTISTQLPPDRPSVQRSGYAGFRTLDRPPTLFGRSVWDIDMYTYLAVRVRVPDARSYFINVQTESIVPTDLHQHRLFTRSLGGKKWETVLVRWNDFVRTNHGFVVEPQTEMLRQRVRSVGFGLTDRVPGPFELCVERVWATNDASEGYHHAHQDPLQPPEGAPVAEEEVIDVTDVDPDFPPAPVRAGHLRNKQGKNVSWNE